MELVIIPNFGERISPRIDYAESLQLFSIDGNNLLKKENIKILTHSNLERINLIIRLNPHTIICDGISNLLHDKLTEQKINVIAWVHGTIEDIINNYLVDRTLKNFKKQK